MTRIPAIFRGGKFVPTVEIQLQEETAVELLLVDENGQPPHPDPLERAAARRRAVASMRRRKLSGDIPTFSREELHERG